MRVRLVPTPYENVVDHFLAEDAVLLEQGQELLAEVQRGLALGQLHQRGVDGVLVVLLHGGPPSGTGGGEKGEREEEDRLGA